MTCALLGLICQGRESPLHFLTKPTSKPTPPSPPKPVPPVSNSDDLLAPPEDLDWSTSTVVPPVTASPAKKPGAATTTFAHDAGNGVAPSKAPVALVNSTKMPPLPTNSTKAGNPAVMDDKLAKCKARAECFGIPWRNPNNPLSDPEKLKKRAERFGSTNTPSQSVESGSKRAAPVDEVDAEELER
ncbi:hypothetical protein EDC04DRAFT_2912693 [Pisolithus marmoratus]|nr:hypothetical protein EDC04DRAFT_2912693 [Pisolithus marmoratus]